MEKPGVAELNAMNLKLGYAGPLLTKNIKPYVAASYADLT